MEEIKKTNGGEYYHLDGTDYVGLYVVDRTKNIAYIYKDYSKVREVLVPRYIFNTETVRLRSRTFGGYASPQPYIPALDASDYSLGFINRYFVQKRTTPMSTIVEISESQFNMIGSKQSRKYLNSKIYNGLKVRWLISGNERYVEHTNKKNILDGEKTFKGISSFIKDYKQFYK